MPVFLLVAFNFIKSYWKPLAIVGLVVGIYFVGYHNGNVSAQRSAEKAVNKELERRWAEYLKTQEAIDKESQKIDEDRQSRPLDDTRDSCLLSNDPFKKKCIK